MNPTHPIRIRFRHQHLNKSRHIVEICMFGNPTQRVRILEVAVQVQVDHQCA